MRKRVPVLAALAGMLVSVAATGMTAAAADAAPKITILQPAAGSDVVGSPTTISGTAFATSGIARVNIGVFDVVRSLWLQTNGTWTTRRVFLLSTLGAPAAAQPWQLSRPLAVGSYRVDARATAKNATTSPLRHSSFRIVDPPPPPVRGDLTLQFGRTLWSASQSTACATVPEMVTLDQVAAQLSARGMWGVGVVTPSRVGETTRSCVNTHVYASWSDIARLRDDFGWSFISNGQTHHDVQADPFKDQVRETCGSLDDLAAHGHFRAWGMYGPGYNNIDETLQANVVDRCFAFSRYYRSFERNTKPGPATHWISTLSVAGGKCNDALLACYGDVGGEGTRYDLPTQLAALASVDQNEWAVIQAYRFVTGSSTGPTRVRWDCSSADPRQHWTSENEVYCDSDYVAFLDLIPAGVHLATPADIAERWGQLPRPLTTISNPDEQVLGAGATDLAVTFSAFENGPFDVRLGSPTGTLLASGTYAGAPDAMTVHLDPASLPEGRSTLYVTPATHSGVLAPAAMLVNHDTTPPSLVGPDLDPASDTGVSDTDDFTSDATPTFTGSTDADAVLSVALDGLTVTPRTNPDGTWDYTPADPISDGEHTISATAGDPAGNVGPTHTLTFTIDTAGPVATIGGTPADGNVTTSDTADFTLSPDTPVAGFTCQFDAEAPYSCGELVHIEGISGGTHEFSVFAVDLAGNTGPVARRSWFVLGL